APGNIGSPLVESALDRLPARTVIELTEQEAVADPPALRAQLSRWTSRGTRLALDDVGAGYSGLQQILRLRPEFLKLDRELIDGIDRDRTQQSLVASLVGFAKQAGVSLIAEGVETDGQLRWLREAGVSLGQGYFFAHPGPPWPGINPSTSTQASLRTTVLAGRLDAASSAKEACEAAADHLFALGDLMPSVYLEARGRLRCLAQRGLWQVLDGMEPDAGVTGRTFRTGDAQHIPDVRRAPGYLEAIPGVVTEFCTPLRTGDRVVGALNVESTREMEQSTLEEVGLVGDLLGRRLELLPSEPGVGPLRQLATLAAGLVAVSDPEATAAAVVQAGCVLTGLDSGVVILGDEDHHHEAVGSQGPLQSALRRLPHADLDHMVSLLAPLTSCYSSGEATGRTFVGGEVLREAGACAVVALPLVARGRRTGLLLLASTQPVSLGAETIEPVELLATLAGSCLEVATHLDDLESRVHVDALTGLENHACFHDSLRELEDDDCIALVMFDVDGFKGVNDTHGHLVGDDLLRSMARAMATSARSGTRLFRVGGDELAAMLPATRHHEAEAAARRFAAAAAEVTIPFGAGISAGVAIRLPGEPSIETLARADAALYRAKRARVGVLLA
ncbi:MAG: EAL domain-containing protein, partial [Acidimicrobiales bacterium]